MSEENVLGGPVTLDDVVSAVGEGSPFDTNAAAVRKILGRGSYSTIQKHLDTLRERLAVVPEVAGGVIPAAPNEVINTLWRAAWTAAHSELLARNERLAAKVESLGITLEASRADIDALTADLAQAEKASIDRASELDLIKAQAGEKQGVIESLQAQLDDEKLAHSQDMEAAALRLSRQAEENTHVVNAITALNEKAAAREVELRVQIESLNKHIAALTEKIGG